MWTHFQDAKGKEEEKHDKTKGKKEADKNPKKGVYVDRSTGGYICPVMLWLAQTLLMCSCVMSVYLHVNRILHVNHVVRCKQVSLEGIRLSFKETGK